MHIVLIAWSYVAVMMAVVEAASPGGTLLGAFFTLLFYGVLPVGLIAYLMGTPARRRARQRAEAAQASAVGHAPDAGGHAATATEADVVAPVRKEP